MNMNTAPQPATKQEESVASQLAQLKADQEETEVSYDPAKASEIAKQIEALEAKAATPSSAETGSVMKAVEVAKAGGNPDQIATAEASADKKFLVDQQSQDPQKVEALAASEDLVEKSKISIRKAVSSKSIEENNIISKMRELSSKSDEISREDFLKQTEIVKEINKQRETVAALEARNAQYKEKHDEDMKHESGRKQYETYNTMYFELESAKKELETLRNNFESSIVDFQNQTKPLNEQVDSLRDALKDTEYQKIKPDLLSGGEEYVPKKLERYKALSYENIKSSIEANANSGAFSAGGIDAAFNAIGTAFYIIRSSMSVDQKLGLLSTIKRNSREDAGRSIGEFINEIQSKN